MALRSTLALLLSCLPLLAQQGKVVQMGPGVKLFLDEKRVEVDARVCIHKGLIELFACSEGGKDHESTVVLSCKPQDLHLALVLLGLKDKRECGGGGPQFVEDPTPPKGDRVIVYLEWAGKDGKPERHRAEELISDRATNGTMDPVGWAFSGSEFCEDKDPDTGKPTGKQIYLANRVRTVIATMHDPTSILDTPLISGGDDTRYYSNEQVLPESGTPAKVIIQVPSADELKKMKAIEEKVNAEAEKELKEEKEKEKKKQEDQGPKQPGGPGDKPK